MIRITTRKPTHGPLKDVNLSDMTNEDLMRIKSESME